MQSLCVRGGYIYYVVCAYSNREGSIFYPGDGGGENFFSMFRGIIEIIGIEWLRKQAGLPACFLN